MCNKPFINNYIGTIWDFQEEIRKITLFLSLRRVQKTEFESQKVANNFGGIHLTEGNFPGKGGKEKKLSSIKILLSVRSKEVPQSDEPWSSDSTLCLLILFCAKSLQLCLTLCDPMDLTSTGPSVHGILQARILDWVAISSPGIKPESPMSPALASGFFTTSATWETILSIIWHNKCGAEQTFEENSSCILRVLINRLSLKVKCVSAKMIMSVLIQVTITWRWKTHTHTNSTTQTCTWSFSLNEWVSEVAQLCPTLCNPMLFHPWDSPGKSTGVGCHFRTVFVSHQ